MTLIVLLFALGVLLLACEVFVPGAVLGIIGGVALLGGTIATFANFGLTAGAWAALLALSLLVLTFWFEFTWLPRTRAMRALTMSAAVGGTGQAVASSLPAIGTLCTSQTTMAPSGYVEAEGRSFEAFCRSGHVSAGVRLKVVGSDNFHLIVTVIQPSENL